MKTSVNTYTGLKRNENFASTGKGFRGRPGPVGRRIIWFVLAGMALGLLQLLPVWAFYLFAAWVLVRCSIWLLTTLLRALVLVVLILILACLFL